jgi:predicted DNA-binding ribbon-helix-helix protein
MDQPSEERRCVDLDGRKACVSLENDFWECIEQIASQRGTTIDRLVAEVVGDTEREHLSGVLRVFVLAHYREYFGLMTTDVSYAAVAEDGLPYSMAEKRKIH